MEIPQPSSLRKYPIEYAIIMLITAICFLFYLYLDMSKFVRTNLMEQNISTIEALRQNTQALNQIMSQQRFLNQNYFYGDTTNRRPY